MKKIAFTIDIDWAPEKVIYDTLEIFNNYKIKCTLFCTHYSEVISNNKNDLFEIGIHPNFNNIFNGDAINVNKIIDDLLQLFPESKGIRSHSGTASTTFSEIFCKKGLEYESNILLPYSKNITPYKLWNGLYRIPFNWEDDVHFLYNYSYNNCNIDFYNDDAVFNFHPIHIYLNTENVERYENAKVHYKNPNQLKNYVNKSDIKGTRDLLLDIATQIRNNNINTYHLSELIKN